MFHLYYNSYILHTVDDGVKNHQTKSPQKNLLVRTAGFKINVMQTKYVLLILLPNRSEFIINCFEWGSNLVGHIKAFLSK